MIISGRTLRRIAGLGEFRTAVILLAPIAVAALFSGFLAPYSPLLTNEGPALLHPTLGYPMGTDQAGGDVFSQVVYGARVALYVGVVSTLISLAIAIVVGLPAGYYGGVVSEVFMRFTDMILSIPSFVLIILLVILFGSQIDVIVLTIGLLSWPTLTRIIRAEVLSLKEREFVLAAKALGANSRDVMFSEILPNVWFKLLPAITLQMGLAVLIEAGISFLGLGDPNASSWGRTLWLANRAIFAGAWWGILFPGLAIIVTILGFNILGDALGKATNPREL